MYVNICTSMLLQYRVRYVVYRTNDVMIQLQYMKFNTSKSYCKFPQILLSNHSINPHITKKVTIVSYNKHTT
jgi:hypothetical protein